jgi:TRAP-type uncharacterized transport system substrate-binding protein
MPDAMKSIIKISFLLLLVIGGAPALAKPVTELNLILPELEVDRAIARRIVELVSKDSGLRISLVPIPEGSKTALDALETGFGDIAFAANTGSYREGISTVIPLYPSVLQIVADKARPADSVDELLRGASIYAGAEGSISRSLASRIVDGFELAPGEVSFVDDPQSIPDVIVLYAPIDRDRIMNDPRLENVRWFSFGEPEDVGNGSIVDLAVFLNPRLRPFVLPAGTFGKLTPEPVVTVAVDNLMVARSDLGESVVYDLYAEILRLRPALFSARPELYQPLAENIAQSNFAFSLHPGALSFLKRDEPTFIERYSGVAEVVATLMVGLVSGIFAIVKIYRIRRKNRLDEFLVEVIEIRNSVQPDSGEDVRVAANEKIRALQDQAFELLVDEKLAADDSFRIFTELSNDTIRRIAERRA